MEVTGKALSDPLLRGWLLELMKPDRLYDINELVSLVTQAHEKAGGHKSTFTPEEMRMRFYGVLSDLYHAPEACVSQEGWEEGKEQYRLIVFGSDALPTFEKAKATHEATAEVTLGEGEQSVYGWYLPTYRELAELKGEAHFPVKVGRTTKAVPYHRLTAHLGTSPEKPKLGFLWRTDNAELWEKVLHIKLRQRGQHMTEALGNEWFWTNPQELREIVRAMAAKMAPLAREAREEDLL